MAEPNESDPHHRARKIEARLHETIGQLRADVEKVQEPHARAVFETTAEVLVGLEKAFHDYDKKNELAWG